MKRTLNTFTALILWTIFWSQPAYAFQKHIVTITPDIAVAFVGDTIQFAADVLDSSGNSIDTTLNWEFTTNSVGSIDSAGLLIAEEEGLGFLRAFFGDRSDIATVIVQDSSLDSTGIQTIKIIRAKKNPNAPADTLLLEEGSYYKLTSFQFPLNVVNGGILHFPTGSLSENIKIELKTSSFAVESGDSLIFPDSIINTIDFRVFIDDNLRTPYFFKKPVKIAIPFKRGLLEKLGISPFDIGMFFFNDSTGFDSSGVTNIAVDTVANRIFADINRFENVVLAKKIREEFVTAIESPKNPREFLLKQNYPNPFNPVTKIEYTLSANSKVSLIIYNLLGQEVAQLINGPQSAGTHIVFWDASKVSSGIYFYRLQAGDFVRTKKMVLLK